MYICTYIYLCIYTHNTSKIEKTKNHQGTRSAGKCTYVCIYIYAHIRIKRQKNLGKKKTNKAPAVLRPSRARDVACVTTLVRIHYPVHRISLHLCLHIFFCYDPDIFYFFKLFFTKGYLFVSASPFSW